LISLDTTSDVSDRQIDAWRRMTPSEKLSLAVGMSQTVRDLALAGVRQRYPRAAPREQFLRLAILVLGIDLARKAYPDIDSLDVQ